MTSNRLAQGVSVLALCIGLVACGGGGVSSTPTPTPSPTPTPTSTPTPAPTPTPTPVPTPTPTPTPAPTPTPFPVYTPVAQMTGDHRYKTVGTRFNPTPVPGGFGTFDFSTGVEVDYNAELQRYQLYLPNVPTYFYLPSNIISTDPETGTIVYRFDHPEITKHPDFIRFFPKVDGVPLSYMNLNAWAYAEDIPTIIFMIGGAPTLASDVPKNGTAAYSTTFVAGYLSEGAAYSLDKGGSTGTFSADFGAGTVSTDIHLLGYPQMGTTIKDFGTLTGTGTISGTSPEFAGTVTQGGAGTGYLSGAFFGPQAQEMGFSWYFIGPDFKATGMLAGTKD